MKKSMVFLTILLTSSILVFGTIPEPAKIEKLHEASFYVGGFYSPIVSQDFYGINIDFTYSPYNRYLTGLNFSYSKKQISTSFSYDVKKPIIEYSEIGWINQYNFVQKDKVRIGLSVNNGLVISRLGDNSNLKPYPTRYSHLKAAEVATNYFYTLQPGLEMSFRLFSKEHDPDFYLTTKAKYRYVFGSSKYGQMNDFSNYYLGLGISIIGFTDDYDKREEIKSHYH